MSPEMIAQGLVGPSDEGQVVARHGRARERRHDCTSWRSVAPRLLVRLERLPDSGAEGLELGYRSYVRGSRCRDPQALHRRSRDSERNCARGRDFCVSAEPGIALASRPIRRASARRSSKSLLGVAFWIVLTLVASALPVKLPRGHSSSRRHRPDRRGDVTWAVPPSAAGSQRLARPRFARFAGGSLGTEPWPTTPGLTLPAIVGGRRLLRTRAALRRQAAANFAVDFLATMVGGRRLLRPQHA